MHDMCVYIYIYILYIYIYIYYLDTYIHTLVLREFERAPSQAAPPGREANAPLARFHSCFPTFLRSWFYYTIPYHTIPYHTIPYHTILYYTIPYHTILYYTILYHTILYYTLLHHTISNQDGRLTLDEHLSDIHNQDPCVDYMCSFENPWCNFARTGKPMKGNQS